MAKRIKAYLKFLNEYAANQTEPVSEDFRKEILVQIGFFQHERIVHLIVTVTFAILAFLALFFYILTEQSMVIVLFALLMVLLIPYIQHYYLLENSTQKMYEYYDKIIGFKAN